MNAQLSPRQVRERQYRRMVATGLGVSVAIHGAILGLSTFEIDTPVSARDAARAESPETVFETPALELVTLKQPSVEATEPEPAPAQAPSRVAAEPTPRAASPRAMMEVQLALSMQHDFTTQREVSDWALQPIRFAGNDLGGDDEDDEDNGRDKNSGGRSWWEGLGIAVGIGGGGHCPVPGAGPEPYVSR